MNKKMFLITLVILVAIIGAGAYVFLTDDDKSSMQQMREENTSTQNTDTTPPPSTSTSPGAYIDYTDTVIASTEGTKLLFFYAPWCPQCRALEADIKSRGVPEGVTIIKIDYDSNQSLRQKYGVTIQTTVVRINDQGELVKKYVAYDDPSLKSVENNLL